MTIAYDGTKYHGWQTQPKKTTIQGEIEKAINIITKQEVKLIASGRTDKGVHALGQVANFIADTNIESEKIKIALNANLPKDIRVLQSEDVPMEFHARFDALKKTYMYQIYNDSVGNPFYRNYSFFVPYKLDVDLMNEASKLLIGTHDFKGFMAAGSQVKTTVRTIYSLELFREKKLIKLYITGNGFLYNMVRIIVGTLIDIGKGTRDISCIKNAIETGDRTVLGYTANPEGLFLKEVLY